MNASTAAQQIKRAYAIRAGQYNLRSGDWLMISEVADMTDLTREQMAEGIKWLMREEDGFSVIPESNQKTLTQENRDAAVWIGNQWKHLICWY